jgi:uncharacterized membrane protein YjjP (DUF1212 family)
VSALAPKVGKQKMPFVYTRWRCVFVITVIGAVIGLLAGGSADGLVGGGGIGLAVGPLFGTCERMG